MPEESDAMVSLSVFMPVGGIVSNPEGSCR